MKTHAEEREEKRQRLLQARREIEIKRRFTLKDLGEQKVAMGFDGRPSRTQRLRGGDLTIR